MKPSNWLIALSLTLLLFVFSSSTQAADRVVSVDPNSGLVTVDQRGTLKSFRAKPFTEITLNGAKAKIEDLRAGMTVTFALSDPQTLSKITARGNPAAPMAGQAPTAPGATAARGTLRRIILKLKVDGSDLIKVGDGKLWIEHKTAKKPTNISVNGVAWEPTWSGNKSEPFTGFNPALAPFSSAQVSLKQVEGRGGTKIVEPPTAENGQTLAFLVEDGGSGAGSFEIRVTWQ